MRISQTVIDDTIVFTLEGDLDLGNVQAVERRVAYRRAGDRVTIDARALRFLDSSALALLLRLQRVADEGGWEVSYVPGEALVTRARRTGLDRILRFTDAPFPPQGAPPGPAPETATPR